MRLSFKKYAIEFMVIFMSITVSFIVEEWRTSVQEKKLANEYLQRLKTELTEKTARTQGHLAVNKASISAYEKIATNFKTREINSDSLFLFILMSEGGTGFQSELTTWESLKSSGDFASIKPELIDSVNSLLRRYKGLEVWSELINDMFLQTWPHFLPDIPANEVTEQWIDFVDKLGLPLTLKPSKSDVPADFSKFLNNSIAVDYFFTRTLYSKGIDEAYKSLPAKEKRLIELIEKEIAE